MPNQMNVLYAATGMAYSAIFLVGIIVLGSEAARFLAIGSALAGCVSQYIAQDPKVWKASIYTAYACFILALFALGAFMMGN